MVNYPLLQKLFIFILGAILIYIIYKYLKKGKEEKNEAKE